MSTNQPKSQFCWTFYRSGFVHVTMANDDLILCSDTSVHNLLIPSPPFFSTNHILLLAWGWGGFEDEEAYLSAQHILRKQW